MDSAWLEVGIYTAVYLFGVGFLVWRRYKPEIKLLFYGKQTEIELKEKEPIDTLKLD